MYYSHKRSRAYYESMLVTRAISYGRLLKQYFLLFEINELHKSRVAELVAHHDHACLEAERLVEENKTLKKKLETLEGKD